MTDKLALLKKLESLQPSALLDRLMLAMNMPTQWRPSKNLTAGERCQLFLEWAESAGMLEELEQQLGQPESTPPTKNKAVELWQEKLEYLQQQEAVVSDPAQKFALSKQIEEAERKIAELGGRSPPP